MKELLSAFQGDVFRPIVTLFVPGCIAVSTWFIAFMQSEPKLAGAVNANRAETLIVLAIVVSTLGMVLEDWGSRLESFVLDWVQDRKTKKQFKREWNEYLLVVYETEPVAKSYLRGLLMRLKFELDSTVAFTLAGLGSLFMSVPDRWATIVHAGPFIVAMYLFWEAYQTHALMGSVRHDLLDKRLIFLSAEKQKAVAGQA